MASDAKTIRIMLFVSVLGGALLALGYARIFIQHQRMLGVTCERWQISVIASRWEQWLDQLQSGRQCQDDGWAPGVLSCIHCQCRSGRNTWDGTAAYCGASYAR